MNCHDINTCRLRWLSYQVQTNTGSQNIHLLQLWLVNSYLVRSFCGFAESNYNEIIQTSYFGWLKKGEVYVGRHYFLIVTLLCDTFWHCATYNCRCKSTKCSEVDWPIWSIGEMQWSLRRVTGSSDTNGACHKTWLLFKATKNKRINCTIFPHVSIFFQNLPLHSCRSVSNLHFHLLFHFE